MSRSNFSDKKDLLRNASLLLLLAMAAPMLILGQRVQPRIPGQWIKGGNLSDARAGACTVSLSDGRMLAMGGQGRGSALASAELMNAAGDSTSVSPMASARSEHVCAALDDGRVLVAGGRVAGDAATNAAEIYDAASDSWTSILSMREARIGATLTRIPDGRLLIAGGEAAGRPSATLEIFDPSTGAFSLANGAMSSPRKSHAASLLRDGRVLIAGGVGGGSEGKTVLDTAEVFDPANSSIRPIGRMTVAREGLSATLLDNGQVLIAGGSDGSADLASSELFDAATMSFSPGPAMSSARRGHKAFLMPHNNTVVMAGGEAAGEPLASTDQFAWWGNRYAGEFKNLGDLSSARTQITGAPTEAGMLMIAGGMAAHGVVSASRDASPGATVFTDKTGYAPGEHVLLSGSGFTPGETVHVTIHESPVQHGDVELDIPDPNNDGAFSNVDVYTVEVHDLGTSFHLIAESRPSGVWAETSFTDDSVNLITSAGSATIDIGFGPNGAGNVCAAAPIAYGEPPLLINSSTSTSVSGVGNRPVYLRAPLTNSLGGAFINWTRTAGTGHTTYNAREICSSGANGTARNFTANYAAAVTVTTTSVTSNLNPSTYGDSVTFSASVTPASGPAVSCGTVAFKDGATTLATVNVVGGAAATSISTLSATASPHSITAVYTPAVSACAFTGSTSGILSQVVNKKPASVTPNAASKTYGDADPAFTGTLSGFQAGDGVTATYTRTAGETVAGSPYTISATLSPAGVLGNYTITSNTANFTITAKPVTVTADSGQTKIYGAADPAAYTYSITSGGPLVSGDSFSGALTRVAGESASSYAIQQGTLALSSNYAITYVGANFTITVKPVTVTADSGQTKVYGAADPAYTYSITSGGPLVSGDSFSGALTRDIGESVGAYAITKGTLTAGSNYTITYVGANFSITAKPVTPSITANDKTYDGNATATLASCTVAVKVGTDDVACTSAAVTFASSNASASPQTVTATSLTLTGTTASNYTLSATTAPTTAKINPKAATWTTNPNSKTYGDAEPVPLTTGSESGFLAADGVTAAYSRAAGETVLGGPYHITATLSATGLLSNYTITNVGADFTINPRAATWTTNPNSKTYGDPDPSPLTTGSGTFLAADGVTATYSRVAGETVLGGAYHITATLGPGTVLSNYTITNAGASFTITVKPVTPSITANDKTYDGNATATLASCTVVVKVGTDDVACTSAVVTFASSNANAIPQTVTATSLTLTGATASNYTLSATTAPTTAKINPKAATWTTNPNSKTYGDAEPAPLTTGSGIGFLVADGVTATYSRAAGETAPGGPYHITATLSATGLLSNYTITNVGASFTINPRAATWTTNPNSKTYGDPDPSPLTTGSGTFLAVDGVTAAYSRAAGETVLGGPYHITATLGPAGVLSNYTITNAGANFAITPKSVTPSIMANDKTYDGNATATLASCTVAVKVGTDDVACTSAVVTFASSNANAIPQTVTATSLTLTGATASNYTLSATTAPTTAKINPRLATWTTNPNSKTYGDAEPAPLTTGSGIGFLVADGVTATYSRAAGETVPGGPYQITATLSATGLLSNYTITNAGASFTITPRAATWTTNPNSKTYGDPDPSPLTLGSGTFLAVDGVTAAYSRAAGETVPGGPYHITATLGPAAVLSNYTITNAGASFTITVKSVTPSITANDKTYDGNATATLASCTVAVKVGTDDVACTSVTVTFASSNANAIPQTVTATSLTLAGAMASNYTLSTTTAATSAKINPRLATWTTSPSSKTYGDADPAPLTTGSGIGFLVADGVTATYSRAAGETVPGGPYQITATLSATGLLSNYTITNAGANFTINKRLASVTPNAATKTYGDADPVLTGLLTNFVAADGVTAVYSRTAGETVPGGPYHITATLGPAGVLSNYTITNVGANFAITPKSVTPSIMANDKTYDGNATATLASCTVAVKVGTDDVACTSATVTFGSSNANAIPQDVTATSLTLTGATASSYMLSTTTAGSTAKINPRLATWTTNPNSKTYGNADPAPLTTGSGTFLVADGVMATYSRAAGETVPGGPYQITATLSATGLLSNYTITNAGANFTINKRLASVTPNAATKTHGDADPVLTGLLTNFVAADGVTAVYSRTAGETVAASPYTISAAMSPVGVLANYTIAYNTANFTITARPTITSLNSSLYLSVTPVRVDLMATVTSAPLIPTGSVSFTDSIAGPLGTVLLSGTGTAALSTTALGVGQHVITATFIPTQNFGASMSAANTAPVATITGPATGALNAVNTPFNFTATFSDAVGNSPTATAAWSFDALSSIAGTVGGSIGNGTVTNSYAFAAAGVYSVLLTVNDNNGGITIVNIVAPDNTAAMVVVYDPNGGFVTGGGWIMSQPGAYVPNPGLSGKANFGFVSKYQKGATIPTGNTEFDFKAGNMNFHSTVYQWLVVAGARAQFKGDGTINNAGNYGFLLTALDGEINGGGNTDKFRIKIWDKNNGDVVVYDNAPGSDDIDQSQGTPLTPGNGNGSIVIHK